MSTETNGKLSQSDPSDPSGGWLNGNIGAEDNAEDVVTVAEETDLLPNGKKKTIKYIDTSNGRTDGLTKCPKCGSSEVKFNQEKQTLQCLHCRHEWQEANAEKLYGFDSDISELKGNYVASGADQIKDGLEMVTIKCQGCGAEIVLNTKDTLQTRCHWCRQTLSLNQQIPNGAIPDAVLPFMVSREEAVEIIEEFAHKRRLFAKKAFKEQFKAENVLGVYMPYMIVDANCKSELGGVGRVIDRKYTVTVTRTNSDGEMVQETEDRYDVSDYQISREFKMLIDDLPMSSSAERNNVNIKLNTNNIIDAIQPFDINNAVAYNPNYLKGFTSEKRDLSIDDGLDDGVIDKLKSIARNLADKQTIGKYDAGVQWQNEHVDVIGSRWVSIYAPIWLYSYCENPGTDKQFIHYIAVNGRTKKVMGSVPVNHVKVAVASLLSGVPFAIAMMYINNQMGS